MKKKECPDGQPKCGDNCCPDGESCGDDGVTCECTTGLDKCGDKCCPAAQTCVDTACQCPPGLDICGDQCCANDASTDQLCDAKSDVCVASNGCQTAFAATRFGVIPDRSVAFCGTGLKPERWGWTNGPYSETSRSRLEMFGGAAQCQRDTYGEIVGAAGVEVVGDTVKVGFRPDLGFQFTEYHIQVSCDPLKYALNNDDPTIQTIAPSQYTVVKDAPVMPFLHGRLLLLTSRLCPPVRTFSRSMDSTRMERAPPTIIG